MGKQKREKAAAAAAVAGSSGGVGGGRGGSMIEVIGEDLVQVVLSKLPAKSFASAACVSRSWTAACRRVLSRPKLSSAVSLNPSLRGAVEEVVDKVLSEPIRPHFAILCITHSFNLRLAHKYVTEKLGSNIPVVSCKSYGIMGRNAFTNEFEEIQREMDHDFPGVCYSHDVSYGISLTVGFVPGLKVDALPLLWSEDFQVPVIDKFVFDIRDYTNSVSCCTSPAGIIMFGGTGVDMKNVLDKMDYAMHPDTFIVGDECCKFLYRVVGAGNHTHQKEHCAGVALLFMKDSNKPRGIGDIQFHVAISTGMTPIGPTFKAAAVKEMSKESSTWLSATNGERREYINGQTMLHDIEEELGDRTDYPVLYIGVTKRRKCSVGLEKPRWSTSMVFHDVNEGDETYLFVHGCGIKTGDYFRFYYPDSGTAQSSSRSVSKELEKLKRDFDASSDKKQAFGGFIFTCCGRGKSFFGETNIDSTPFLENFPGVPLGGKFCGGEIKRGSSSFYCQESQEQSSSRCCLHPYSSVYLVMSYMPPPLENQI